MWVQLSIHTLYICVYTLYSYSDICTDIGEFWARGVARMCQHLRSCGGHYWKLFLGVGVVLVVLVLPSRLFAFGADLCFSISDL